MTRNHILAFAATGLMLAMLGTLIYGACDIHETQPFGIDPEVPFFMLGSILLLCMGTVALTVRLLGISLALAELLPLGPSRLSLNAIERSEAVEVERLLFSPPRAVLSLRI